MKKRGHKSFWNQKQIIIAGTVMVVAAAAMTWVYMSSRTSEKEQNIANNENQQQVAEVETEEPAESVTKIIKPKTKKDDVAKKDTETVAVEETESEEVADVMNSDVTDNAAETVNTPELHFSADSGLNWPLQGNVILNYSMDHTIYFATLDQYKYNPAVIIGGVVNDRVSSATAGQISDISTNEETGMTVTVDLGDGYSAIYGQLKEVPYSVGDYVESGSTIGYLSEPTKYYSVEGCNLYFELQKDGAPVDPVSFFE